MANKVTTEWFDAQVKYGNYLPLQKERTLAEQQKQMQQKHAQQNKLQNILDKKNIQQVNEMQDDLDFDDQFTRAYMAKRRLQLEIKAQLFKYGQLKQIIKSEYIKQVTQADPSSLVLLHLYSTSNQFCQLINEKLKILAKECPHVKFLKIVASKCIEGFPDQNTPCFIIYKAGKPIANLLKLDDHLKKDINQLDTFLAGFGIKKLQ